MHAHTKHSWVYQDLSDRPSYEEGGGGYIGKGGGMGGNKEDKKRKSGIYRKQEEGKGRKRERRGRSVNHVNK